MAKEPSKKRHVRFGKLLTYPPPVARFGPAETGKPGRLRGEAGRRVAFGISGKAACSAWPEAIRDKAPIARLSATPESSSKPLQ